MLNEDSPNNNKIQLVLKQKELIKDAAKQIVKEINAEGSRAQESVNEKLLDIAHYLSVIASLGVDKKSHQSIVEINRFMENVAQASPYRYLHLYQKQLKGLMIEIVAIEVNFDKRSFSISFSYDIIRHLVSGTFRRE